MIEEGLYDNEPSYVRATIYERIFGQIPAAGFEAHDTLIDREKLQQWIVGSCFVQYHCKLSEYAEDGEERSVRYYVNNDNKTMITISRRFIDPNKEPNITNNDEYSPSERNNIRNPNKLSWFSFYGPAEEIIVEFKKIFDSFKIEEEFKNRLYMLKSTEYGGLELDSFPTSCSGVSLELNYGDGFLKTHERILNCLCNKKSGLYVFHGCPGSGKTSYIKFLTTVVEKRRFIFVPNTMVSELFSPKMVDKLYSFKNSVLVLEDAEICVFKRDGKNNELVSGILNITDGLLKDLLNISIVVTFNTADIGELDPALLRPGRLKIIHKFNPLALGESKRLARHLGKKKEVEKELTLADIYNLDEDTGIEDVTSEKTIGFYIKK